MIFGTNDTSICLLGPAASQADSNGRIGWSNRMADSDVARPSPRSSCWTFPLTALLWLLLACANQAEPARSKADHLPQTSARVQQQAALIRVDLLLGASPAEVEVATDLLIQEELVLFGSRLQDRLEALSRLNPTELRDTVNRGDLAEDLLGPLVELRQLIGRDPRLVDERPGTAVRGTASRLLEDDRDRMVIAAAPLDQELWSLDEELRDILRVQEPEFREGLKGRVQGLLNGLLALQRRRLVGLPRALPFLSAEQSTRLILSDEVNGWLLLSPPAEPGGGRP